MTLIGDEAPMMNKPLFLFSKSSQWSERQECKLRTVIACPTSSNEICAEGHGNTGEKQLSLRLRKGLVNDGREKDTPSF